MLDILRIMAFRNGDNLKVKLLKDYQTEHSVDSIKGLGWVSEHLEIVVHSVYILCCAFQRRRTSVFIAFQLVNLCASVYREEMHKGEGPHKYNLHSVLNSVI